MIKYKFHKARLSAIVLASTLCQAAKRSVTSGLMPVCLVGPVQTADASSF